MDMFKRVLAFLLALVMLVGELPTVALAEMMEQTAATETVEEETSEPTQETAESEETEAVAAVDLAAAAPAMENVVEAVPGEDEVVEGEGVEEAATRGELGEVGWEFYSYNGQLALYATDLVAMPSLDAAEEYPWYHLADRITQITVNNISGIGDYAFADCTGLTSFRFDYRITELGDFIFAGCTNLSKLIFDGSAPEFSANTFHSVTATVSYPSGDTSWTLEKRQNYGGNLTWPGGSFDGGASEIAGGSCGDDLTWSLDSEYTLSIFGTGAMADYENGGSPWYQYIRKILRVEISDGVTTIGANAFSDCSVMTEIAIPDSVTLIGSGAFGACSELTDVTIPEGVTILASGVFSGCSGLTEMVIPEGVTVIGDMAFMSCMNLASVTIPGSVEEIGMWAFYGCSSLVDITMKGDAPTISEDALTGVSTVIRYPANNPTWTEAVTNQYGGSITWIAEEEIGGGSGNEGPTTIGGTYGDNVTWTLSISGELTITGEGAMEDQTSGAGYPWYEYRDQIDSIEVKGLTGIGDYAFAGPYNLGQLIFGDTVTSVGSRIMDGCVSIDIAVFMGMPPVFAEDAFAGVCSTGIGYRVPLAEAWAPYTENDYGADNIWWSRYVMNVAFGTYENMNWQVMDDGSLRIRSTQYQDMVTMPDLEEDEAPWLEYADQITILELEKVEVIGKNAFRGLEKVNNVIFCETLASIGEDAFAGCTDLENLWLMPSLTRIGARAFAGCTSLEEINFQGSPDTIGENAFLDVNADVYCYDTFPEEMKKDYGGSLTWNIMEVPSELVDSGWLDGVGWDLYDDGLLVLYAEETTAMPDMEPGFDYPWLSYADQITEISVSNISRIGNSAFAGCTGVTEFVFDYHIRELADYIFYNCTNLSRLVFHGSAPEFSVNTFYTVTATVEYPTADPTWTAEKRQNYNGNLTWLDGGSDGDDMSGSCGENIDWALDAEGVLNIIGEGPVADYGPGMAPWYRHRESIVSLRIGEGISAVGQYAMYGLTELADISLPDSMTIIDEYAFYGCSKLQTVALSGNVDSIGTYAFADCTALRYFTIRDNEDPGHVTYFACDETGYATAFSGCSALQSIGLGNGVKYIPGGLFRGCEALESMSLSDSLMSIGNDAFFGCGLTEVQLPGSVSSIGTNAFGNCTKLDRFVIQDSEDPGRVTEFACDAQGKATAFSGCTGLRSVQLGNSVKNIPEGLFQGRAALVEVLVSDSLMSIGNDAFADSDLRTFTVPGNVSSVGTNAFGNCALLESIIVADSENPGQMTEFACDAQGNATAFAGCTGLESAELGNSVKNIPNGLFRNCEDLQYLTVSDSLMSIGNDAFAGCDLTSVTLPGSITGIGTNAFGNCTQMAVFTIEDSENPGLMTEFMTDAAGNATAFAGCSALSNVELGNSVKNIPNGLFSGCVQLAVVEVSDCLMGIGCDAFADSGMYAITIPESVTAIEDNAFGGCKNLYITFLGSAPSFAEDIFAEAEIWLMYPASDTTWWEIAGQQYGGTVTWVPEGELVGSCGEDLTWTLGDDGVLVISGTGPMAEIDYVMEGDSGYWAAPWRIFQDNITSVVIESGVTTIEGRAFLGCNYATQISIPDTVESIGYQVFGAGVETITVDEDNAYFCTEDGLLLDKAKTTLYCYPGQKQGAEYRLPGTVTKLRYDSVMSAYLRKLTIPAGVREIEENAFAAAAAALEEVVFEGNAPDSGGMEIFWELRLTAYYPEGNETWTEEVMQMFGADVIWVPYEQIISEGYCGPELTWKLTSSGIMTISGIGEMNDFDTMMRPPEWKHDAAKVKEVIIEEGVTYVGSYAFFADYINLTRISLPDSLTGIGNSAFAFCGLTGSLTIPEGVTCIGAEAFRNCSGLTVLKLGRDLTEIGEYAFAGCSGLTGTVIIPAAVTRIGANAFQFSSKIQQIRFESVDCPEIANDSLGSISGLKSIYVPGTNYASYADLIAKLPAGVKVLTDDWAFPVKGLNVSATYSKTVALTWDAHESGNALGYQILRDGVFLADTTECSYEDRELEPQKTYTYTVKAYFENDKTAPESQAVSATTVLPEITGLTGYLEYANRKLFAGEYNEIFVTIADHGNLAPLSQQKNTLGLYYQAEEEQILIGWAQQTETAGTYSIRWDLSILSDGEYTLLAVLTDVDGTTAQWTETVVVDNTVPGKLLQVVANGTEQTIQLSWTRGQEYDTAGYNIYRSVGNQEDFRWLARIDGAATLSFTDNTAAEDETCYYYVVAVDIFGREAMEYDIVSSSRIRDTEKPRVVQMLPSSGSYLTGTVTFSLKAEDNVAVASTKLEYSVDNAQTWTELPAAEGRYTLDTTALADGEITLRATALDAAGNMSDALRQSYTIDNTGPAKVTGLSHVSTSVTMTLRWEDVADQDIGGFLVEQLQKDGTYKAVAENVTALGVNLQGLNPGTEYTYRVTAYDIFGNKGMPSDLYTASTEADTTAPVTVQILPAPGSFRDEINLSATVEDDSSLASATLEYSSDNIQWNKIRTETYSDGAAVQKISARLNLSNIPEGLLYVRATAVDLAGNMTENPVYVQYMVDKTAPEAPSGVTATGCSGYVELRWNSDMDAVSYRITRSETENGTFVPVSETHTALNYFDRSVEDGATYYYRVAAVDAAGNVSPFCETVSAQASPDHQAPEILSISPADGSTLSSSIAQVSVLAKDNSALESVLVEYSHDGVSYVCLVKEEQINAYGGIAAGTIPVAEFAHGDTVYLRAVATDAAGNSGEETVVSYIMDLQAPKITSVGAAYEEGTVVLTWKGEDETDLAGYRIYRRSEDGVSSMIGKMAAESGRTSYSWTDDSLPVTGGTFSYQVEAVDAVGNTATGSSYETVPGENTPVVQVPKRTGPTALLICDSVMTSGVEYVIDGSGSVDDGYIVSYAYDFGDGTTGTGKSPIHSYTAEGSYTVSLTVTDNEGNSHTVARKVVVKSPDLTGSVTVRIVDEKGAPVPNAPVYFDLGEETEVIRGTDASGYVSFTAEVGRHTVGCVILDNQWLPVKRDLIVKAGATTSVSMTLINKPIVEGSFEIKRMTLEEIEAAGIDLSDPANQNYVEVVLHLEYGNVELNQTLPYKVLTEKYPIIFDPTGEWEPDDEDDDDDPIIIGGGPGGGCDDNIRGWFFEVIDKSEDPKLMILDIPIGVQSLKEMFDVRLHILNNSSSDFSMKDNVITLDTPEGLSVVTDAYMANRQTVKVAEIPGQTQKTVEWIVRGDQPGEYTLGADYSGTLTQFNEPLTARFEAKEPIRVYGMSGLKLEIIYADQLDKGTLYYNVMLTNDGEVDIYKPAISTEDVLIEMELYDQTGMLKAERGSEMKTGYGFSSESLSTLPDILKVGDSLVMHYMCIDQTDYTHCTMKLHDKASEYQYSHGFINVKLEKRPLSYFKSSLSASVNPVEKAQQTLNENADAFDQLMEHYRYICWRLANSTVPGHMLPGEAEELSWEVAQGEVLQGRKKDLKQAEALIVELLGLAADATENVQFSTWAKWLSATTKVVRDLKMERMFPLTKGQGEAFKDAFSNLDETFQMTYDYMVQNNYTFDQLFVRMWEIKCEERGEKFVGNEGAKQILHEVYAEEQMVSAWKKLNISLDVIGVIIESLEDTNVDVGVYMRAQANVDTFLFLLDSMIKQLDPDDKGVDTTELADEETDLEEQYDDTDVVLKALKNVRSAIKSKNVVGKLANNIIENTKLMAAGKAVDWASDKLLDAAGASATGMVKIVQIALKLTAVGLDALMNLSERYKMADNVRFVAILSEVTAECVYDKQNVFKNGKTVENAEHYMELIALMLDLRALGESQVALYGKSFETDFTIGNLPLLKAVRSISDAEEATSWYQWRNIVEDRISRLRVELLRNPVTTEVTGRERPTVSFDYGNGRTIQSFGSEYEYSLDKGATWTTCIGGPIEIQRPESSVELWVRRVNRSQTDMVGTGSVIIYGPNRLYNSGIEVLKTPTGYRIDNLNGDMGYQVTFSAIPLTLDYESELELTLPEGSTSYVLDTEDEYSYVYIRTLAGKENYASHVTRFSVVSTVTLKTYITGEGLILDHEDTWEYGSEVSLTAVPAAYRYFDGWYQNGVKVSGEATYTFRIYGSIYLEARFVLSEEVPLPGVSADVDPIAGTAAAVLEDGTEVKVSGIPQEAFKLVVEMPAQEDTVNWVASCMETTGVPVRIYDLYLVDDRLARMQSDGLQTSVGCSGSAEDLILCGIGQDGTVRVLQSKAENGAMTFATDGSVLYVLARLLPQRNIKLQTTAEELLPGRKAKLTAAFEPGNPTGTTILWSLAEGDSARATLTVNGNEAVLTAKTLTESAYVTVTARAADGSFPATSVKILILPPVNRLDIQKDGETVTGKQIRFDLNREGTILELKTLAMPEDALQDVTWKSSDNQIAEVTQNGLVTFHGKTGQVTLTATAADGSGQNASVTVEVVAMIQNVKMATGSVTQLLGGKSAGFQALDADTGVVLNKDQLTWSLDKEYEAYATISADGVLQTRTVLEATKIVITGRIVGNEEYGVVEHTVTLLPLATYVELWYQDQEVTDETVNVATNGATAKKLPSIRLEALVYPDDARQNVTWSTKNTGIVDVSKNGVVTVKWDAAKGACKSGTVTITATAADGSKAVGSVKLNIGVMTERVQIEAPALELRSGKKMTLSARTVPANPTKAGVTWNLAGEEDADFATISSSGKLSAKTVYEDHTVMVRATAKDGSGAYDEIPVLIRPKLDGILTILADEENVTKSTVSMDLNTVTRITLSAYTLNDTMPEDVDWKTSSSKVTALTVNEDGSVTVKLLKAGAATITAKAEDGRTATVTLKGVIQTKKISVTSSAGTMAVMSGKSITLKAQVQPTNATSKAVLWSVAEEDAEYATISSSGKLTAAKKLQTARTITVIAEAKDGGAVQTIEVLLRPMASGIRIVQDDRTVTGTTLQHNLTDGNTLQVEALVYPLDHVEDAVVWKSSSTKIASISQDGVITCKKVGTTTITATAADGSKVKATFKLKVEKWMTELTLPDTAVIAGGKTLTMTKLQGFFVDPYAGDKTLIWSMEGDGAAYATLSSKGVLKTKKVTAPKTLTVTATAADGGQISASCEVTIHPATTKVQVVYKGVPVTKTLELAVGKKLDLDGICQPANAADEYTWKSSATKYATVNADGVVTAVKAGKTVSISCLAADGSGKSAVVKVKIVNAG